jgi:hypothetical protein
VYLYDTLFGFTFRYRQGKSNEYMHKSKLVWQGFSYSSCERQNPWSQCIHNLPHPELYRLVPTVMQWVVHKPHDVLPACTCQQASGIIRQHIPGKKKSFTTMEGLILTLFKPLKNSTTRLYTKNSSICSQSFVMCYG